MNNASRAQNDPAVQGRLLRTMLRTTRLGLGLLQSHVARDLDWSPSKLLRIERGEHGISTTDLKALLELYEIRDPESVAEAVRMAQVARKPAWASQYADVLERGYISYLMNEGSATAIRQVEPLLIPGVLQTEKYARAVIEVLSGPEVAPRIVERRVQSRMEHQQIMLESDDSPQLFFVLDAAAIRRQVGSVRDMEEQFARLASLNSRSNISIQILPFAAGIHLGLAWSPFILLEFPGDGGDYMLYIEKSQGKDFFSNEESRETGKYLDVFEHLTKVAAGSEDLERLLTSVLSRMEEQNH